jgi:ATP-binding cassette subfamily F protein 3
MQALNLEKDTLQAQLASTKAPAELAQAGKRVKAIDAEIGTLEERWLELTEQIETVAV